MCARPRAYRTTLVLLNTKINKSIVKFAGQVIRCSLSISFVYGISFLQSATSVVVFVFIVLSKLLCHDMDCSPRRQAPNLIKCLANSNDLDSPNTKLREKIDRLKIKNVALEAENAYLRKESINNCGNYKQAMHLLVITNREYAGCIQQYLDDHLIRCKKTIQDLQVIEHQLRTRPNLQRFPSDQLLPGEIIQLKIKEWVEERNKTINNIDGLKVFKEGILENMAFRAEYCNLEMLHRHWKRLSYVSTNSVLHKHYFNIVAHNAKSSPPCDTYNVPRDIRYGVYPAVPMYGPPGWTYALAQPPAVYYKPYVPVLNNTAPSTHPPARSRDVDMRSQIAEPPSDQCDRSDQFERRRSCGECYEELNVCRRCVSSESVDESVSTTSEEELQSVTNESVDKSLTDTTASSRSCTSEEMLDTIRNESDSRLRLIPEEDTDESDNILDSSLRAEYSKKLKIEGNGINGNFINEKVVEDTSSIYESFTSEDVPIDDVNSEASIATIPESIDTLNTKIKDILIIKSPTGSVDLLRKFSYRSTSSSSSDIANTTKSTSISCSESNSSDTNSPIEKIRELNGIPQTQLTTKSNQIVLNPKFVDGPKFHKLMEFLNRQFPHARDSDLTSALLNIREKNGGKLSGLSFTDIVAKVDTEINHETRYINDTEFCPICLDKLGKVSQIALMCEHVFHTKCIRVWLMENSTCPVCKLCMGYCGGLVGY